MQKLNLSYGQELQHFGMCDASGAIAIVGPQNHFLVANDEDNILRIYNAETSGNSTQSININDYFTNNPKQKEVDIEAAAILNDTIYWITSHGRSRKAKARPERRNFFANKITRTDNTVSIEQVGQSYSNLVDDLLQAKALKKYDLDEAENLAPKDKGGLNIEGLCTTPAQTLLIGFRNPIPEGKALLIPLENPAELVGTKETSARFGQPIELDLGKLGIRSIEYWQQQGIYLIVAGPYGKSDDTNPFELYQWSGQPTEKPEQLEIDLPSDFNPEAAIIYPNLDQQFQLLSDDGSLKRDGKVRCKDLDDSSKRYFRSAWINLQ